ncbi:MAG: hypothetical protein WD847_02250 [Pirellulales bacterium]
MSAGRFARSGWGFARSGWSVLAAALMLAGCSGCQVVSRNKLTACETQHHSLSEQNKALLAENENLKAHSRQVEDRLIRAEEDLAALDERSGLDR